MDRTIDRLKFELLDVISHESVGARGFPEVSLLDYVCSCRVFDRAIVTASLSGFGNIPGPFLRVGWLGYARDTAHAGGDSLLTFPHEVQPSSQQSPWYNNDHTVTPRCSDVSVDSQSPCGWHKGLDISLQRWTRVSVFLKCRA